MLPPSGDPGTGADAAADRTRGLFHSGGGKSERGGSPRRTNDSPAGRLIAEEIRRHGPITFARFMALALYDPGVGYYTRASAGPGTEGDYVTSSELHPAFGALLCAQLVEMWEVLGRPSPFWLVEGGPGSGAFASDVLTVAGAAFPRFADTLRVALLEASPGLRARQRERLHPWGDRVRWLDAQTLPTAPLGVGCIFANELLDALPVHRVSGTPDGLVERYVAVRGDTFEEIEGPLSTPEIGQQIADGGGHLAPGHLGEVNLAAPAWARATFRLIARGYGLLLDYGEPASTLYGARHPRGTLRCYWRHTLNEEPLCRVGEQDITAHVDLSAVSRAAAGVDLLGATSQEALLGRLGLPLLVDQLRSGSLPSPVAALGRTAEWGHRRALEALVDPHGLGHITALLFGKNALSADLTGFSGSVPNAAVARALAPVVLKGPPRLEPAPPGPAPVGG